MQNGLLETENRGLRGDYQALNAEYRRLRNAALAREQELVAREKELVDERLKLQNEKLRLEEVIDDAQVKLKVSEEEVQRLDKRTTEQADQNYQLRHNLQQAQPAMTPKARRRSGVDNGPLRGLRTPVTRIVVPPAPNATTSGAAADARSAPKPTTSGAAVAADNPSAPKSATADARPAAKSTTEPSPDASADKSVDESAANQSFLRRHAANIADSNSAADLAAIIQKLEDLRLKVEALQQGPAPAPKVDHDDDDDSPQAAKARKARAQEVRETEKRLLPSSVKNIVHKKLRDIVHEMFGTQFASDFAVHVAIDAATVELCEQGGAEPDMTAPQWDFRPKEYHKCEWNRMIIDYVVMKFFDENPDLVDDTQEMRDFLAIKMGEKLREFQRYWLNAQRRTDAETQVTESLEEAHGRAAAAHQQRQLNARSNSSKHRKYLKRKDTVKKVICILLKDNDPNVAVWRWILEMLKHLDASGMSSEEGMQSPTTQLFSHFEVLICQWREPRIEAYMKQVDAQTATFDKSRRGPKRAERRRPGTRFGTSSPPKGLPTGIFNASWVAEQDLSVVKQLKMSKAVFDFFDETVE
uniref:Uncharacterized protein n=1 Tax=Mycena chlorophos TaxID=658473 RepID=A0ABQ0KX41_MYCCL|nr:predicted protein [Mycena chlorophos]